MIVTLDALLVQAMWHSAIQLQTFPNDGKHEAVKPKQVPSGVYKYNISAF